ncbi:MAG: phosphoribosylglycinamide formyltransferase [candidate division WOR-3 bacterium]|nr:phosphoribosylglycinamide formyltransferase [candidate division WOR-3 bacterium]
MLCRVGVLVSGRGTNLQSIIDKSISGEIDAEVAVVISDNPKAQALNKARKVGIKALYLDPATEKPILIGGAEDKYLQVLKENQVDLVCLAGFMRVLKKKFISEYKWRIMNIHPALLPSFKGLHAQRQALNSGARFSGATVHFVTGDVDGGPIILQVVVPIYQDDTEESLSQRILKEEHRIYPECINLFAKGKIQIKDNKVIIGEING